MRRISQMLIPDIVDASSTKKSTKTLSSHHWALATTVDARYVTYSRKITE
jgi:hypothetical protein